MWKIWSANISQDNQSPCSWISVKMSHSPKYCIIIFLPEKKQVENWEDGEAWSSVDAKEQLCCVCFTSTHLHLLCCDSASQDIDPWWPHHLGFLANWLVLDTPIAGDGKRSWAFYSSSCQFHPLFLCPHTMTISARQELLSHGLG